MLFTTRLHLWLWLVLLLLTQQPVFSQLFQSSDSGQKITNAASCNTWTFQLRIGSSKAEQPVNALQLPTGSYIVCGNDSSSVGKRGRLLKLSTAGTVLFSKEIAFAAQDFVFEKLRLFSDGKLYGVATVRDPLSNVMRPVLLTIDTTALAVTSTFLCQPGTGSDDWKAADVGEGAQNSTFIYAYNDSLINITKLSSPLNTVVWSKSYRTRNKPRPIGIGVEFADVYFAWNETDSGYAKGVIASVDFITGNYKYGSRTGGAADGSHITLQSFALRSLRPRVTALHFKNGQYQTIRLFYQYDCSLPFTESFQSGGYTADAGSGSRQNAPEETIALQAASTPSVINLIHTYPENYNDPIEGWQLQYPVPVQLSSLSTTNDGGHFVLNTTTTQPSQLVITKTDSIATLPGCQSAEVPTTFSRGTLPFSTDILPAVASPLQLASVSVQVIDLPVIVTEDCKSLYCPSPPQPDSCLRTFLKEYRSYGNTLSFSQGAKMDNGKFLVGGSVGLPQYTANPGPLFTIIDTNGRVLDSRLLTGPDRIFPTKMIRLRDGNVLAAGMVGASNEVSDCYLIKLDQQLNILWQKKIVSSPVYNAIDAVIESVEGELYCYLHERLSSREIRTILKLDATANPVWMRQYDIGPSVFAQSSEHRPALVEMGDGIIVKYNEEASDFSPMLMRLRKSDGVVEWVRRYQMDGPFGGSGSYSLRSLISDGTNMFMLGMSQSRNVVMKLAADGSVVLAKRTPAGTFSDQYRSMDFGSNGKLLVGVWVSMVGKTYFGNFEMDKNLIPLRRQFLQPPRFGTTDNLIPYSDSVIYATGNLHYGNAPWLSAAFFKYNFNSSFAKCAVADVPVVLDVYIQPSVLKTVTSAALALPQSVSYSAYYLPVPISYSGYHCGNNTACTNFSLQGPAIICDSSSYIDYRSIRSNGCDAKVLWLPDTTAGQISVISSSDSLFRIRVRKSGSFVLRSKIFANCGWLEDSLVVHASLINRTLDLGNDTTFCTGNSIILNAGTGFGSYLWQDHSTDSIMTVTQPGLYYVEVRSCSHVYKDSVLVSLAAPISFSVGPDRTKCNNDTLRLSAPSGFLNYAWSNNYNLSSTSTQNVVVNPLVDTAYFIKAEKTPGCFAFDTVRITVHQSPAIHLGNDRSFCTGDSVVFNADAGFAFYQWSSGQTAQQVVIKTAGQYSVIGTTLQGCKSYDTVKVLNVYPLPVVNLDKGNSLCSGSSKTLHAGSFASYDWNTGATTPTIVVNGIGQYTVRVTDINGCVGQDAVAITIIHPLPAGFLPPDTAVCSYGTVQLKPATTYNSYLWSNNAIAASITVSQAGIYWLEVADGNTCRGRDSVVVNPKQCMTGFYAPSAFTPNGDGKNDAFQPLLFGRVKNYSFTVYNRWGQIIFQTTEQFKAWDGKLGGIPLQSGVFVWVCTYQFEGEGQKSEKGTLTLIR